MHVLAALLLAALTLDVPKAVRQGETIHVQVRAPEPFESATASCAGKTVALFVQPDGRYLGLIPVKVDQPPGRLPVEIRDAAGKLLGTAPVEILDARFRRQNVEVTTQMRGLEPLPGELDAPRQLRETVSAKRFWSEPFLKPVPDCVNSPFGVLRYHNGKFTGNYHRGLDQRASAGRQVRATAAGVVKIARMGQYLGGTVGIDHGQGVTSIYLHLSRIKVSEGATVGRGDVVGWVGGTGFATGPHLHWQIQVNGLPVNPRQWVPGLRACAARRGAR